MWLPKTVNLVGEQVTHHLGEGKGACLLADPQEQSFQEEDVVNPTSVLSSCWAKACLVKKKCSGSVSI